MTGWVQHDAEPALVTILGLVLCLRRSTGDRPRHAGGHILDPDVATM
jgi:hypothetical protein